MWRVVVGLQLAQHVDQNSSVKHGLAIHFRDDVANLLKCQSLH